MENSNYMPGIGAYASPYLHKIGDAACAVAICNWNASTAETQLVLGKEDGDRGLLGKEMDATIASGHDAAQSLRMQAYGTFAQAAGSLGGAAAAFGASKFESAEITRASAQKQTLEANRTAINAIPPAPGLVGGAPAVPAVPAVPAATQAQVEQACARSYTEGPITPAQRTEISHMLPNQKDLVLKRLEDQQSHLDTILTKASNDRNTQTTMTTTVGRSLGEAADGGFKIAQAEYKEDEAKQEAEKQLYSTLAGVINNTTIAQLNKVATDNEQEMNAAAQAWEQVMRSTHPA